MVNLVKYHNIKHTVDLDQEYQCPDCTEVCWGYELVYLADHETMYVCPNCGCIQEEHNIVAQLSDNE